MSVRFVTCLLLITSLTGCSTLLPESSIPQTAPKEAYSSLTKADEYADDVSKAFIALQINQSKAQAALSLGTLGLASLGAAHIAYNHSLNRIKGTALGLALITGADYVYSPISKRGIVDRGLLALTCARQTAYAMDAMPTPLTGDPVAVGNPSPISHFVNSTRFRSQSIPVPSVPNRTTSSLTPAGAQIRKFASSIKRSSVPVPAAPGARSSGISLNSLIPIVDAALEGHEKAMNEAVSSAEAVKASAAEYLASTAELVARLTISELHSTDRSSKDIADAVSERNNAYLGGFQDTLLSTQKKLQETKAQMSAITKVAEQASAPVSDPGADVAEHEEVDDTPPAPPSPRTRVSRNKDVENRKEINHTPQPQASSGAAVEENENLVDAGGTAVAAVQNEENILSTLEMLSKMAAKCSKAAP